MNDAEWLAHRHVEPSDAIRFVAVPRADHEGAPFLVDEALQQTPRDHRDVSIATCLRETDRAPFGMIFHSAFCGSTLLTRALSLPGLAMGLSEPVLLNDVVGFRQRGASGAAVARLADVALRLLARRFAPDEPAIVKPSNVVNPLAELFLSLHPQAQALFLYAPLETFLVSVARKGLACRLWARELAARFAPEGMFAPLGISFEDLFAQVDLQVAAAGWLAQHRLFQRLADKLGPHRLKLVDADQLIAHPATTLPGIVAHLGLRNDDALLADVIASPALARHSKSGEAFTAQDRSNAYREARAAYASEIDGVLDWSRKVADNAGILLDPT
ncbi:sulfotransferase family protein [Novosphingobium huizhouense]|uniref:hypothetical protein n=1 Tax=Novosphingobium huizhouense TaxID=2866625 RepID=UPI001CD8237F|nr:hypothetical protein [Novosphingobium huizhouense]